MPPQKNKPRKPDPERMAALRSLPLNIKQSLTKEEVDAFLYEAVWPETLFEKLEDFIVEENQDE